MGREHSEYSSQGQLNGNDCVGNGIRHKTHAKSDVWIMGTNEHSWWKKKKKLLSVIQ